jgi:hypothetical protein
MDYESKYLKYKEKYLSLKNQYGGAKIGDEVFGTDGKKWGEIVGENDKGLFNGKDHGEPIFIYNNVKGNTGYLLKRNEGQKWVAKSKPGLLSKAMEAVGTVFGRSSDSGAAAQSLPRPPSGAFAPGPKAKFIYMIEWRDEETEHGGLITLIADSDGECYKILKDNFHLGIPKIHEAISKATKYELKGNPESGVVKTYSFL